MRKDVVIIDADGTLCNDSHRDHLAKAAQWEEFHSLLHLDEPFEDVVQLLRLCVDDTVVLITARNERYRERTMDWLRKHSLDPYIDVLLMRPDDDFRSAAEVKISLMENWFAYGCDPPEWSENGIIERVKFVLDDRDKVVDAFRTYGLPCWQVRGGTY